MIGKQIGSGGTSEVYEWGNTEVIKIYKSHVGDDVIENESCIGHLLNKCALNIPKCIGLINYNEKKALIYERVDGKVMAAPLLNGVYTCELGYTFAQLHFDIHKKEITELPTQYDFLKNRILELKSKIGDKTVPLLGLLDSIPLDNKLCHGDFQPLNILVEGDKYTVIDWNGACSGNPILDVAWSYLTMNSPIVKSLLGDKIQELLVCFTNDYITNYCILAGIEQENIMKCLPIVAARRLYDNIGNSNENSIKESEWLLEIIHAL